MTANYFRLAAGDFTQDWSNLDQITQADDWSNVPSIQGFRGDNLVTGIGVDPQTVLMDGSATPLDINANETSPNFLTVGGLAEFELLNPVVALNASGTADAPHLVIYLDTTDVDAVQISYTLRDLDGTSDNAIQPIALQYRIGETGFFVNVPEAYVADASSGPNEATLVTLVRVTLPEIVNNQSQVQLRLLTTNAVGNDEWIGIDDIVVSGQLPTPLVTITALTAAVTEGDGTPAQFEIRRTGNLSRALTVACELEPGVGQATAADIAPELPGTVTFAPGQASILVSVTALADAFLEGSEALTLRLVEMATYALGASALATFMIADPPGTGGDEDAPDPLPPDVPDPLPPDVPDPLPPDVPDPLPPDVPDPLPPDVPDPLPPDVSSTMRIIQGDRTFNRLLGSDHRDTILGYEGHDVLIGGGGNDILNGGLGGDRLSGGTGRDLFSYRGVTQRGTFARSRLGSMDRIVDFDANAGDRIRLDYDQDLGTGDRPTRLFNAGIQSATTLLKALGEAYADRDPQQVGHQRLRANEAVFFEWQGRQFLSLNNAQTGCKPQQEMLIEMTGMQFYGGDAIATSLAVTYYFV